MKIYVKIGTQPAKWMHVVRKRVPPKIGDSFELKESTARRDRYEPTVRAYCDKISDLGAGQTLYFVERM
jgi:hypothetical protein